MFKYSFRGVARVQGYKFTASSGCLEADQFIKEKYIMQYI